MLFMILYISFVMSYTHININKMLFSFQIGDLNKRHKSSFVKHKLNVSIYLFFYCYTVTPECWVVILRTYLAYYGDFDECHGIGLLINGVKIKMACSEQTLFVSLADKKRMS